MESFISQRIALRKWLPVAAVILVLAAGFAFAQDYTIDQYNEYQKAVEEGPEALLAFIEAHPESSLTQYALDAYVQKINGYVEAGQHPQAVEAGQKFLEQVDGDKFEILYLTTWSSFYSQQYDLAIRYGEKAYSTKPDAPQLEQMLARSYLNTGNTAKAVEFGKKFCDETNASDCYDLLPAMMRHYVEQKDWSTAAKWADLTIKAFNNVEKPSGVSESEWQEFAAEEKSVAYSILGRNAYETGNFGAAAKNYQKARDLSPSNQTRGAEGYYYEGMSLWNQEQLNPAMEMFAKCSCLEGNPYEETCRERLEELYKGTHNGSLAGLDEFLDRACR